MNRLHLPALFPIAFAMSATVMYLHISTTGSLFLALGENCTAAASFCKEKIIKYIVTHHHATNNFHGQNMKIDCLTIICIVIKIKGNRVDTFSKLVL
jgi:hypothetical protein